MAKRRIVRPEAEEDEQDKKEEHKKHAFKPPEFDETEFLQTENRSAKLIYISLATAFVAGIVTFGIMTGLHFLGMGGVFVIPLIIPVIFAVVTVYLFSRFGIDIKNLEWKKWLENGFMYVVAWFAVWLVSMNPPFSDFADPTVSEPLIEIEVGSGQTFHYLGDTMFVDGTEQEYSSISNIEDISTVTIYTTITDNWDIKNVDISVVYSVEGSTKVIEEGSMLNLSIFKAEQNLDVPKNISRALNNKWLISDDDVRKDKMHIVSMVFDNQTDLDLSDGIQFTIIFKAKDTRNNEVRKELSLKITS